MTHVRLPYRITLTLGTFGLLAILAGCGRDASQGEVEALRKEVADLKQANAQLQTTVATLQAAIRDVLALPEVKERFDALGSRLVASTPEDFRKFLAAERTRWAETVKAAGIKKE